MEVVGIMSYPETWRFKNDSTGLDDCQRGSLRSYTRPMRVGLFLGVDSAGYHRFISSRKSINGPTLGDYKGRSILEPVNGTGLYAHAFRAVRRL